MAKIVQMSFEEKNLKEMGLEIYDSENKMDSRGWHDHILRQYTCVSPSYSKFFSETAWPIKVKFDMKHLQEGGTNVYITNPGHMTKIAAMSIYGINPVKPSSP